MTENYNQEFPVRQACYSANKSNGFGLGTRTESFRYVKRSHGDLLPLALIISGRLRSSAASASADPRKARRTKIPASALIGPDSHQNDLNNAGHFRCPAAYFEPCPDDLIGHHSSMKLTDTLFNVKLLVRFCNFYDFFFNI